LPFAERRRIAAARLVSMVRHAALHVPYYRDLVRAHSFDPDKLERDPRYLEELPYLTKDIIREQSERLLSQPLAAVRHHAAKTGGSTGQSAMIYYDQTGADYAAAVVLYARELAGKKKHMFEVHFASRFPEVFPLKARLREYFKCFAMNRSNIFFDSLDDEGLEAIWRALKRQRAYLAHAHPSTMYALACYVRRRYGTGRAFEVFESSGEWLGPYMRREIAQTLGCRVVDRYGLAELGVVAYQPRFDAEQLLVLDSEAWPEMRPVNDEGAPELVFTGLRNCLMPLIRYRTGDRGRVEERSDGYYVTDMMGRVHDVISINGTPYATHYVQDVLGRVGGIQEFQVDVRSQPAVMRIVPEPEADRSGIAARLSAWWPNGFELRFVGPDELIRVGWRNKFRHVVDA
jgi:phenylacetate-CoA ligase